MKKLALIVALSAGVAVAVPAQASKPENPGSQRAEQGKAHAQDAERRGSSAKSGKGKRRCTPRSVAYVAFGQFVSSTLTQTQGAATTDNARDDRWSGELVVAVKRTNRHARSDKGTTKTYMLTDARVRLADRNGDGTPDAPVAGDRTRVLGKITRLNRGCDATAFTPELKIRSVGFHKPKPAETSAPAPAPAP